MSEQPTRESAKLNIYQRINRVREAVEYVRKDKKVDGAGYLAVTHDAVTAFVRPHLVKYGIIIAPTLLESKVADSGSFTAKQIPIIRYEAVYRIAFINADDPSDQHVIERQEAHALDQGDKAPGKALSYAVKMAMLKIFSLETGEEEEGRIEQLARGKKPDAEFDSWKKKIEDAGAIGALSALWQQMPPQYRKALYEAKETQKKRIQAADEQAARA